MRIWKLMPTDLSDPRWKIWKPDPIYVRAESEAQARRLAQLKTTKVVTPKFGEPIPINPWGGHHKIEDSLLPTTCEDVTQTNEYSVEGLAAILNR